MFRSRTRWGAYFPLMSEATLIFPHQLFDPHPALGRGRAAVFIEDGLVFGGDPHVPAAFHQKKLVLLRAAMKTYAAELKRRGHHVVYRDHLPGKTVATHLGGLQRSGFASFHLCETTDFLLEKRLDRFAAARNITLHRYDTPMFLTPGDWMIEHFRSRKRPSMAAFYEAQRVRMGILLDQEGKPLGGRWSFDGDNRKPMPKKGLAVPPDPAANRTGYVVEAQRYVRANFGENPGDVEGFAYPVSHDSAGRWLERFLDVRLAGFGPYEDAVSANERVLFHSVLTPMLNCGLLTPAGVIEAALAHARVNEVPLNSLEGFVRQIIGWREFMRAMYDRHGVEERTANFWGFEDRPIPEAFYRAATGIAPIDTTIRRVLDHAYCHHIERLMLLGSFMMICGFHPTRVYRWFMELFIDAYDWVMVPNVYGMSQFASGGLFTTKPYVSGSNYVRKMSDYPQGDWCQTWDGLFWTFIKTHETFFRRQHRLAMMAKQLDRMGDKINTHRKCAESFLHRVCYESV